MKVFLAALALASVPTISANVIYTLENPTVQNTTVANTTTVTFDNLSIGSLGTYVSPIGVYSPGGSIVGADLFGGANGSKYIATGKESGFIVYTLTFFAPQSFFGLDWTGADPANKLEFLNGSTVVATFGTYDIQSTLATTFPNNYLFFFGNPNDGSDPLEPFFYVNFYSDDPSTNFTSVRFSNADATTGFESDNHAIRLAAEVPEPSSVSLVLLGLGIGGLALRRKLASSSTTH